MRIPAIRGLIDRRILVNYRVDPAVLARILPPPFRPQLVLGHGIAGICLIRLKQIRPRFLPSFLGIASENAAHRIAVEWDTVAGTRNGVFVPRRDTSSRLNAAVGGRLFSSVQHHARFDVLEQGGHFRVAMHSIDRTAHVLVDGSLARDLPDDSIFPTVADLSGFFEGGSLGYSPGLRGTKYDGLEFHTDNWHVEPLAVERMESSFFEDRTLFPAGSVVYDSALLMRGIEHEWHSRESICCAVGGD